MRMEKIIAAFLVGLIGSTARSAPQEEPTPEWLWTQGGGNRVVLSHSFGLDYVPEDYSLTVTADFATVDISVNGTLIGALEAYDPVTSFSIQNFLKKGANQISIDAVGVDGPSAVAAEMRFRNKEGHEIVLGTNSSDWNSQDLVEKGPVLPERWAPNRLPEVSPSAEYNQWKEALGGSATSTLSPMPPGFSISLVRNAKEEEDSWVSLALDPKGRLVIARESKGLLRFSLDEERREVIGVEMINESLAECRGLAFRGEVLFANANNSKALYRLRDTTGDDRFDETLEIQTTSGSVGHGRNDLVVDSEGRVHTIHGDSVNVPERTSFLTAEEDPKSKPLGHWITLGPKDKDWTVLARGLRNPYGIDFNSHGEAFTYDADNEGDVGLPFYLPSRINHLVAGGNYGWHQRPGNTRSLPSYAPDTLPTTFDIGRGSPTGVKFVPPGLWGSQWNDVLLALDWAYGRIVAIKPVPRGASYSASGSVFLEGRPLNVTDLEFDENGVLWFVTGGRKTKSALYRVAFDAKKGKVDGLPEQAAAREKFSTEQRSLRRQILAEEASSLNESLPWNLLGHDDPWIRHGSRVRLERRPTSEWKENLIGLPDGLAKLTGALALARQGNETERNEALSLVSRSPSDTWRRTEKLTYLRIAELAAERGGVSEPASRILVDRAVSWISKPNSPITKESVRLLSLLNRPETIEAAQPLLAEAKTQPDQLFYLEMLSRVSNGWTETTRTGFFKALAVARQVSRGDRFLPPFFKAIESEALSALPESDRDAWAELLRFQNPSLEAEEQPRTFVRNWALGDFKESDFEEETFIADSGLRLFRKGLCHRCHLFGKEGTPVGPDLSQAGNRYSSMDLLQSILEPSSVVAEVYRNVSVETKTGESLTGRLVRDDFRKSLLYLSTNPFAPDEITRIPKNEVVTFAESEISPMPTALLSSMTKEEIIQLIRWLRTPP